MYEAATFQRNDNRTKDAARIELLKEKGMEIEENPDINGFRAQVADLREIDLFRDPKVQALLDKVLAATR